MNCKIILIDDFKRDAKKLLKKFASLKDELSELETQLLENPRMGTLIHQNIYKIPLAVKSKGKGKSGGLRVISYVVELDIQVLENTKEQEINIFLLTIYDKSEMQNIPNKILQNLIDEVNNELDNEDY